MAYRQAFNADALPAFPEPERKDHSTSFNSSSSAPAPSSANSYPPRQSSHPQPPQQQQYANKPPPPRPDGRQPSPALHPSGNGGPRHGTPVSRPPPSPAPRSADGDPALLPLFRQVDKDNSGTLTEKELRMALVNGDWTTFDPHTVTMMIRMFDTDRSGSISFPEFCGLWRFLADWRSLFDRFDADRSGSINLPEYQNALTSFGYRLSSAFTEMMFRSYDKRGEGNLSFDLFVQSCISLKRMTDVFKRYDDDRDGFITLSFESFLTEILRQR